jgi:7,8-dihydropterin-6-yl-methyl-4-(beta-D-ribofuranosyl)aminobenzene 5'-phosphate synthase
MIKIQILMENKTYRDGLVAEHGLSLLIDAGNRRILFDAGASPLLMHNIHQLSVDPKSIDTVIISHGHFDHTGGLPAFLAANSQAKVHIHKEAFHNFFGEEEGKLDKITCGIRWNSSGKEAVLKRAILTDGPLWLDDDMVISGTIPVDSDFVPTEPFYIKEEDGSIRQDDMAHEQFLAIRDRDAGGVHLIAGCSHTGTLSAIRYAAKLFPGEPILSLTGGFHMYSTTEERRQKAIDELIDQCPGILVPLHCTGIKALCELRKRIGDRCLMPGAGDKLELK